jgi:glyoxylase-like metal-dependent hydrolase (beta-lactamase superfamily II)
MDILSPPADQLVRHGEVFEAAGIQLDVLELPGHSAGHVVFLYKGRHPWLAFVGDVIFERGIGRTDFPDGNTQQLLTSIRDRIYTLPDETNLLPGHGAATTVAAEKQANPFVRG